MAGEQVDAVVARRIVAREAALPAANRVERGLIEYMRPRAVTNPEEAMKIMAGREIPPRGATLIFVDQQIGPADLPTTTVVIGGENVPRKNRTGRQAFETAMTDRALDRVNQVYEFLERGNITNTIRGETLRMLYNDPGYRVILTEMLPGIDAAFPGFMANPATIPAALRPLINEIIRNPGYNAKLRELLKSRVDLTKPLEDKVTPVNTEVTSIQREVDELTQQLNKAVADSLAARANTLDTNLAQYQNRLGAMGGQLTQLQNVMKDIGTASGAKAAAEANIQAETVALREAVRLGNAGAQALARGNITAAQGVIKAQQAEIERLTVEKESIQAEEKRVRTDLTEVQREIKTARDKLTSKTQELNKKKAELAVLENEKRVREQEFSDNIIGLFADAGAGYLTDALQKVNANYDNVLQERNKTETDAIKRELNDRIRERYFGPMRYVFHPSMRQDGDGWQLFHKERQLQLARTEDDMNNYRAGGGRELLQGTIGDFIEDQVRDKYGGAPITQEMRKEIESKRDELVNDKQYGNEAVLNLLVTRQRLGRPLTLADARLVQKYNPNIFDEVVARDKSLREEIEKMAKANGINDLTRLPEGLFREMLFAVTKVLGFGGRQLAGTAMPY